MYRSFAIAYIVRGMLKCEGPEISGLSAACIPRSVSMRPARINSVSPDFVSDQVSI